jgi:hypothetical protein
MLFFAFNGKFSPDIEDVKAVATGYAIVLLKDTELEGLQENHYPT